MKRKEASNLFELLLITKNGLNVIYTLYPKLNNISDLIDCGINIEQVADAIRKFHDTAGLRWEVYYPLYNPADFVYYTNLICQTFSGRLPIDAHCLLKPFLI